MNLFTATSPLSSKCYFLFIPIIFATLLKEIKNAIASNPNKVKSSQIVQARQAIAKDPFDSAKISIELDPRYGCDKHPGPNCTRHLHGLDGW